MNEIDANIMLTEMWVPKSNQLRERHQFNKNPRNTPFGSVTTVSVACSSICSHNLCSGIFNYQFTTLLSLLLAFFSLHSLLSFHLIIIGSHYSKFHVCAFYLHFITFNIRYFKKKRKERVRERENLNPNVL